MKGWNWRGVMGGCCAACLFQFSFTDAQAAVLVEMDFEESGSGVINSGTAGGTWTMRNSAGTATDLHTGGVGLLGGRVFDNTASSGMGSSGTGGRITSSADINALDNLVSFTISGWIRNISSTVGSGAVIYQKTGGASGPGMYLTMANSGNMSLFINNSGALSSSANSYRAATNDWLFFAVTFNGASALNNVNFYVGTANGPVTLVNSLTTSQSVVSNNSNIAGIGNSIFGPQNNRPFDGMLDNFRLHGSQADASGALSLAELEGQRYLDTTIVPEPTTVMLMLLGAPLWRAIRRRMEVENDAGGRPS